MSNKKIKTLGELLKSRREELREEAHVKLKSRFSLRGMSKATGLGHVYLYNLETGRRLNPSIQVIKKLSIAYKIPFEAFERFS